MKLMIHDLNDEAFLALNISVEEFVVIQANDKTAPCKGCFGCWLKTPGVCVMKDKLQHIGALMGQNDEMIIISENCYGGYSEPVKRVLDRSISTSLPFFTFRGGKIHHRNRYKNKFGLKVILYGGITETERELAERMVQVNRHNMGSSDAALLISDTPDGIGRLLQ